MDKIKALTFELIKEMIMHTTGGDKEKIAEMRETLLRERPEDVDLEMLIEVLDYIDETNKLDN